MLKLTTQTMATAIENARKVRSHVRVISAEDRTYAVTGSKGDVYTVKFVVKGRDKFAQCSCPAGEFNKMCRHIPAAASVNIAVQSMRRQAETAPVVSRESLIADIKTTFARNHPGYYLSDVVQKLVGPYSLNNLGIAKLQYVLSAIA